MLKNWLKWYLDLSKLGVKADYEDDVSRRIVFSNVVFISLPIVYLIFMIIDYESYIIDPYSLKFDQVVVPIIIATCFLCLWLNRLGKTIISRILFIGLWPLLLHIIPIKLHQTPPDYFLAYPLGLVFHGMLIQLMFSHNKERKLFWVGILLNVLAMGSSSAVLLYFDVNHDIPAGMLKDKYYLYDTILYWLLFNLVTFYILYIIESYIKRMNSSKELIAKQKEKLNELNQNLEELVLQRTQELENQNEKLRQHAFFNAHLLRGPFCRIQGLVQLQELPGNDSLNSEIRSKMKESVEELDARIREIQRLVEND